MLFAALAVSAIVPSLLLIWYFHVRDVYPEPPRVLWTTFGLGVLTIIPAVAIALPLDSLAEQVQSPLFYGFWSAFFGAAIPEELMKLMVLWFYASRHIEFDEPMDGIVYGVAASLGFATLENVLYVTEGGLGVAVMRAVLSVPGHAFWGAIMGYFVGQAKFTTAGRGGLIVKAVTVPILLHGFYDWPLLASSRADLDSGAGCVIGLMMPLAPAIVLFSGIWTVRRVRQLRREQLAQGEAPPQAEVQAPLVEAPPPLAAEVPPPPLVVAMPVASAEKRPGVTSGWAMTILGGFLATGGGLVALGLLIDLAMGGEKGESGDLAGILVGGCLIGVLPLLTGAALFAWGLVRLNQAYRSG